MPNEEPAVTFPQKWKVIIGIIATLCFLTFLIVSVWNAVVTLTPAKNTRQLGA